MKNIEFQFSLSLLSGVKRFDISLPFDNGLVYGGSFCPYQIHSQNALERPFHWYRAEEFVALCDKQVRQLQKIQQNTDGNDMLRLSALKSITDRIAAIGHITLNTLISELDCFSHLAFSNNESKVCREYHSLMIYITDCYPRQIVCGTDLTPILLHRIYDEMRNFND